jgi:hypothetical protein
VRLEDYYSVETAVWQPVLPSRGLLLGRYALYLEGPPGSPKLFLAPAKGGGAPPDACGVGGATASSAASPSMLAGGRRMGAGKGGPREGGLHSKCSRKLLDYRENNVCAFYGKFRFYALIHDNREKSCAMPPAAP